MKLIFIVAIISLLSAPVWAIDPVYNEITGDYRPSYNFSYSVFSDLPKVPYDFWIKKQLFDQQQIPASKLTPEYLQPEIIPSWFDWCYRIYGQTEHTMIGTYGMSIYPSRFDITALMPNESIEISALIYTAFGVELYQGARIGVICDNSSVSVIQVAPASDTVLLTPTYPNFTRNWCQIFTIKITALKEQNSTIKIMEERPPEDIDQGYRTEYGMKYTSGGSILGLQVPKMKIYLHYDTVNNPAEEEKPEQKTPFYYNPLYMFLMIFILIIIFMAWVIYVTRRARKKKE